MTVSIRPYVLCSSTVDPSYTDHAIAQTRPNRSFSHSKEPSTRLEYRHSRAPAPGLGIHGTLTYTRHHQLKNFISTSDPAIIYYASGNEVYALHKSTRKRELIASLQWTPQCLDAAHGWVCVGGPDGGQCAFIFVGDEGASGHGQPARSHSEVDALLPLDLDPESRMLDQHSYIGNRRPTAARRRKPEVQYAEMGTSIVNSVTIYRLRSDPALLDETVVLVT